LTIAKAFELVKEILKISWCERKILLKRYLWALSLLMLKVSQVFLYLNTLLHTLITCLKELCFCFSSLHGLSVFQQNYFRLMDGFSQTFWTV